MNITIRLENSSDYRVVEELTREAFWGTGHADCNEHLLAHKMRKVSAFIPELDFVAEADGKIVGNIMYTLGKIITDEGAEYETLNFGPLSVLPEYQNCGVGKALMLHSISEAKRLGYRAILFFGHPDYYTRFGFKRAAEFGIATSSGGNFDSFMAMPLYEGALDGVSGRFHEDPVFEDLGEEEKLEFDKGFAPKEKRISVSIDDLHPQLPEAIIAVLKEHKISSIWDLRRYSQREVASWGGMDDSALTLIKEVMREHGFRWGARD